MWICDLNIYFKIYSTGLHESKSSGMEYAPATVKDLKYFQSLCQATCPTVVIRVFGEYSPSCFTMHKYKDLVFAPDLNLWGEVERSHHHYSELHNIMPLLLTAHTSADVQLLPFEQFSFSSL